MNPKPLEILFSKRKRRTTRLVHWPRALLVARAARKRSQALQRLVAWRLDDASYIAPEVYSGPVLPHVHFESAQPLRASSGDPRLERGKIRNVELASIALHGRELKGGETFSFWKTIGRPTARRGFQEGVEVRAGCIVPTIGGGLCLLSNALFRAATVLGWDINERSGHSATVSEDALDATVAWPHVDLRLTSHIDVVLSCVVEERDAVPTFVFRVLSASSPPPRWSAEFTSTTSELIETRELFRRSPRGQREQIGRDRKRLADSEVFRTNCYTCDERTCHGRPRGLSR